MLYVTYNDVKMNYLVWDSDDYSVEMVSDKDIKYAISMG